MPYLIDGHNLIPHLGLSLRSPDDELELLELIGEFCRLARKQAEVYFDGAQPGQLATRKLGAVTARFVRAPGQADDAIAARLRQLGADAQNWTVVTSDHRVQANARASHAQVITSPAFARQVKERLESGVQKQAGHGDGMSEAEVREWLDIFNRKFK